MITVVASQVPNPDRAEAPPILVLEDNEIDRYLLQKELGRILLNPLHMTPDSRAAIDYLEGHGPYENRNVHPFPVLMIADLRVWGHSGMDVLAWCRYDERADVKKLPVILLTAHADEEVQRQSQMFRADALLTKPLALSRFESVVEHISSLRLARTNGHMAVLPAAGSAKPQ